MQKTECGSRSTLHDSVAYRGTFSNNNLYDKVYDFISLVHECGGFRDTLLYSATSVQLRSAGINFCTAILRSHHSTSIRLKSGL